MSELGGLSFYGNTKITSMHLYPQRWNVAAQVAEEELKTVTCSTPPMEDRRKANKKNLEKNTPKTTTWFRQYLNETVGCSVCIVPLKKAAVRVMLCRLVVTDCAVAVSQSGGGASGPRRHQAAAPSRRRPHHHPSPHHQRHVLGPRHRQRHTVGLLERGRYGPGSPPLSLSSLPPPQL